jgi:hypothetical protein
MRTINGLSVALAVLMAAAFGNAQATVVTTTSGPVTTYTETFNGGTSFSSGWFNATGPDDYLSLVNSASSSFSFSSALPLSSMTLGFWYASDKAGASTDLDSSIFLLSSTGGLLQVLLSNPGPTGNFDSFWSGTLSNVAAGTSTVTFTAPTGLLGRLKVDDVVITTTAVPEPGSSAMVLAGLATIGFIGRRRRLN